MIGSEKSSVILLLLDFYGGQNFKGWRFKQAFTPVQFLFFEIICHVVILLSFQDGNTPLHAAACNKPAKAGVIQSLLQHGAHSDLVNNEKRTFSDLLEGTPLHEITN